MKYRASGEQYGKNGNRHSQEIILYIDNEQVNEEEIYNMIDDIRRKIANNSIIIEEDID